MIVATEGCQQPFCLGQRFHERHIVADFAIIHSALPPYLFPIPARFSAGADTWTLLEIVRCGDGNMEESKGRDGFVVVVCEVSMSLLEPSDNLDCVRT